MLPTTDTTRALTVYQTFYKVVGYLCLAFFIFCAVMSWRAGAHGATLVFLIFVTLGGYVILSSGSLQMDSQYIRYYLPFRSYQIRWNEVQYIEMDKQASSMVFVGENKQLPVHGPAVWSGKDKREMALLISAQIDTYGIEIRQTEKAMFRLSKNTKDRR